MPVLFSENNILFFLVIFILVSAIQSMTLWKGLYFERKRIVWLAKIFVPSLILSIVLVLSGYYMDVSDYKDNQKTCLSLENKGYVMIGKKCARPIGNNEYIEYDTEILKKE